MTGVRHTRDRAAKWMRYIALALAVIWAGFLTLFFLAQATDPIAGIIPPRTSDDLAELLKLALALLLLWISAAIPLRWELPGGVLLVLEGLLILIATPGLQTTRLMRPYYPPEIILILSPMVMPPFVAGSLFLASRWRSGRSGTLQ